VKRIVIQLVTFSIIYGTQRFISVFSRGDAKYYQNVSSSSKVEELKQLMCVCVCMHVCVC
jgi:hypothetical protein